MRLSFNVLGKPLSKTGYHKWAPTQPDNTNDNEHCGAIFRNGLLNHNNCENKAMFFCEKSVSNSRKPSIQKPPSELSSDGYTVLEEFGASYKFHDDRQVFGQAVASCTSDEAYLFWASSQNETNAIITKIMPTSSHGIWLGIHDIYSEGDFITVDGRLMESQFGYFYRFCITIRTSNREDIFQLGSRTT
jgi:hypothetical protein